MDYKNKLIAIKLKKAINTKKRIELFSLKNKNNKDLIGSNNVLIGKLDVIINDYEEQSLCNDEHINFEHTETKLASRSLTTYEQKLETIYNEQEQLVQEEIQKIIQDQTNTFINSVLAILLMGASGLYLLNEIDIRIYTKLKDKFKEVMLKNYDLGKDTASSELKISKPKTPLSVKQNINAEAEILATTVEQDINNETKNIVQNAFFAGAAVTAIAISIRETLRLRAEQVARTAGGSLVGDLLNKGRATVFEEKEIQVKLIAYQRNEVLDVNTCPMCRTLDGRYIKPDDNFRNLTLVHVNCRGFWVPIFERQDLLGKTTGIPKFVVNRFDTIGGVPIINKFKQFKKKK